MPFTLYHLGPALFLGLAFSSLFSLPALLLGSVVADLEPATAILIGAGYPYHGFFHSFLGAAILAFLVFLVLVWLEKPVQKIMKALRLEQRASKKKIFFSAFFATYFHLALDSALYSDLEPLFPFAADNPLFVPGIQIGTIVLACTVFLTLGIALYLYQLAKK